MRSFVYSSIQRILECQRGTYQAPGTIQTVRSTQIGRYGLCWEAEPRTPRSRPKHRLQRRQMSCGPRTLGQPLPLRSVGFWRTQRALAHATLPRGWRSTLTTRSLSSPASSELLPVTDEKTKPPRKGNDPSRPLGKDRSAGLVPRCVTSLQDKVPLNHSTGS